MFIVAIAIFILIYGGANYYIGLRSWNWIHRIVPFIGTSIYIILFVFIATSYIINRLLRGHLPTFISNTLEAVGSYWMAAMAYFLIMFILIDIFRILGRLIPSTRILMRSDSTLLMYVNTLTFVVVLFSLIYGTINAKHTQVTNYEINVSKKVNNIDELHVVMVSDIHLGDSKNDKRLNDLVDKINSMKPDIVMIPGDIIDDDIQPFIRENLSKYFLKLKPKYGVYASLGNHDYFGSNPDEVTKVFEDSGINILRDKYVNVNDSFYIAGREDASSTRITGNKRKSLDEVLDGIDKSLPVFLIDHQPIELEEARKDGVDLQLSGHTHKGQFFPGTIVTPLIFKDDYGFLKEDNYNIIVSSGFGTWGPPIRIGSKSEIVDIKVKFNK